MRRRQSQSSRFNDSYNRDYNDSQKILLSEFRFYNKQKNVINDDVLKKIQKKLLKSKKISSIFWSNRTFAKYNIGFIMSKQILDEEAAIKGIEPNIYISIKSLEAKFTPSQFKECKYITKNLLFGFIPLDDQKDFLYNLDSSKDKKINKVFKNWNEIIQYLIEGKLLNSLYKEESWYDFKETINCIFDDIELKEDEIEYLTRNTEKSPDCVYHIFKVIEKRYNNKNYRIAFTNQKRHYYSRRNYFMRVVPEDDNEYNLIDEGRIYIEKNDKNYYVDLNCNEYSDKKPIIRNHLFWYLERNINQMLPENENIITPVIYNFYKSRMGRHGIDDETDIKQIKLNDQYIKLLNQGREVKINNAIISKNKIEVVGERFKIEFGDDFIDVIKYFGSIRKLVIADDVKYNFNILYEKLIELSVLNVVRMENTRETKYKKFEEVKFKVNDMEIEVYKDTNNRIKINNIFSRIDDVYPTLSKIICYNNIDEYNKYVKDVSYIGVEWKKMISKGIPLELNNPFESLFDKTGMGKLNKMPLRFSLLWDTEKRTKIYLMLNNTKYLIKRKSTFKRYFNAPRRIVSMNKLKTDLTKCIDGIDNDLILDIVENAIQEAKIVQERGEELVRNTIKEIGAKESKIKINDAEIEGYILTGRVTGKTYFIKKINLDVYKRENDKWNRRCVVSSHTKSRIFEDKLANRLINIYNEPAYIHTL
jgi:hypothetical protein